MTIPTRLKDKLAAAARVQGEQYAGSADRPLRGYLITMSAYAGLVTSLTALAKVTKRPIPAGFSPADVVLCAAATHKLSRLLARDPVTSPLRAPFTHYEGTAGPAELKEDVRGEGTKKTVGELVTCPFCTSVWVATGLTAGLVFVPRTARIVMDALAALAGADILQFAHAWLEKAAE